ncbi:MAG: hypothetical protein ABR536_07310 [Solirubrobacterales bacterium]
MIKPHRLLRDRVTDLTGEATAYLRRRRQEREPFARVYYPGGRSGSHAGDAEAGRALFAAASGVIAVAGAPRTRRERARGTPPKDPG